MYCNHCGAQFQAGQRFCGQCGRPLAGVPASAPAPVAPSRVARHLSILAIAWITVSTLRLLGSGAVIAGARHLFGPWEAGWHHPPFVPHLMSFIGGFLLVSAAVGFVAGWGLLQRRPWARILGIILGILALFDPPFGTALGIYTLWVLLPAQSERDFRAIAG